MSLASIAVLVLLGGALLSAALRYWWLILAIALLAAAGPETWSWLMSIAAAWLLYRWLFPARRRPQEA